LTLPLIFLSAFSLGLPNSELNRTSQSGEQITFGPFAEAGPAPSPNGRWVLFEYFHPERPRLPTLWIMPASGRFSEARPLVDSDDYSGEPSWSPDSQWVCYQALSRSGKGNSLIKVNVSTGEKIKLFQLPGAKSVGDSTSWSIRGRIAFQLDGDIYALDPETGASWRLLETRRRFASTPPAHLTWSPNGTMLAFAVENQDSLKSQIWVLYLKTKKLRLLTRGPVDTFPAWLSDDCLVFTRMLGEHNSELGIIRLSGGPPRWLTQGHDDLTPAAVSGRNPQLFFARATEPEPSSNHFNIFAGFHIWRMKLESSANLCYLAIRDTMF
jgi:hypothetical protein